MFPEVQKTRKKEKKRNFSQERLQDVNCLTSTLSRDVDRLSLALRTPAGDESVASVLDGGESSESAASGLLSGRERRP